MNNDIIADEVLPLYRANRPTPLTYWAKLVANRRGLSLNEVLCRVGRRKKKQNNRMEQAANTLRNPYKK